MHNNTSTYQSIVIVQLSIDRHMYSLYTENMWYQLYIVNVEYWGTHCLIDYSLENEAGMTLVYRDTLRYVVSIAWRVRRLVSGWWPPHYECHNKLFLEQQGARCSRQLGTEEQQHQPRLRAFFAEYKTHNIPRVQRNCTTIKCTTPTQL